MVLFYNTFVAMKRQDSHQVSHEKLLDYMELAKPEEGEEVRFGGVIKHGEYLHALRLFHDHGSGVVRIEASAYRGPMVRKSWVHYPSNGQLATFLCGSSSTEAFADIKPNGF